MGDPIVALAAEIRERYGRVVDSVEAAARKANRPAESVRIVVVTKSQPVGVIQAAARAGIRIMGENYPEEAIAKIEALREARPAQAVPMAPLQRWDTPSSSVEWHMIGHVQSRKAKLVVPHFDWIHSLDSVGLAQRLDRLAAEKRLRPKVLLEFNVGGEAAKYGWNAADEGTWPQLMEDMESIAALQNIDVQGLMTMPPLSSVADDARVHFQKLRKLQEFLAQRIGNLTWRELSMGTSADYGIAVEEGATFVRVGEAILGPRPTREHA